MKWLLAYTAEVGCADASSETVDCLVRALDHLLLGLELDDAHDGAEDLLFADRHAVSHISKHSRLDEEALHGGVS